MKNVPSLETVGQDARYALRTMRKNPAFAVTAILMMALAIGGNTAMFTVIRAVLLRPLEYPDADRLVHVSGGATPTRFAGMEAAAHSFTGLAAFTGTGNLTLAGAGEPEVLNGVRVSANFLGILGVSPMLGRGFLPQEDSAGGAPVAMISAGLWQRRFGGDPQIVGKTANLDAAAYTIIGVLPPHFQFPFPDVDVWMTAPSEWPVMPPKSRVLSPFLTIFGRLKPGVSLEQANAEANVLRHQYAMAHPTMLDARPKTPVEVTPMKDDLVRDVRSTLWMLFGAVSFVLLIACANVASLLLARAAFRSREFAVRSALGAPRARLIGQLLVESLLLSFAGGALGALLATWSLRAIPHMSAFALPRAAEIHLDWVVLGFAALLSALTGVLFGLAPSLSASRPDLIRALRASGEAGNQAAPGRSLGGLNVRSLLSVGQIALSVVLLIGAALLMESVARLRGVDVGYNPASLLTMRVSLPTSRYDTDLKKTAFFMELVRRAGSLPGVRAATAAMTLPMTGFAGTPVQDAGKPILKLNERPIAKILPVTPGYFRTLQIPLVRGRDFTEHDIEDAERVAVIDENLARDFWPEYPAGLDPVGQSLLVGGVNPKPAKIVGIVDHVHQNLEDTSWPDSVYVSFAQNPQPFAMLAIRTAGDPLSFTGAVRAQVQALDPDQPIADVQTMDDLVEAELGPTRLLVILLGSFAAVALLLALIGIYGVIAYSVGQRTQEVGIRRALGAQQSDILRLVLSQGFILALVGIALGLGGAFALTRMMKAALFRVSATDPATFAGVAALFLLAALAASYIPARRAARIDPMAALRVG
ncbi:MAG TPA: ABC transporter permease [Terriglobia bacterium]|jgi:predicted permease|nr:ABC transporter permease [Terriglobia bacterium]